ncbi:hypothetical protein [Litoreibacter halocynthiae]|uniref:hypothetical protein n=1 Tax=Litoreibacter halocynthiae TaxID=1242689 RepID=UPI0024921700|nr:hypothetical protein [Litoreibacter halocynthiae]
MKKMFLTLALVIAGCLTWFIGVPVFKNSGPENRLLVKAVSCRIKGCTEIEADFHDYGGMRKVPASLAIARRLEKVTLYIFELEDISALLRLQQLKEVDIRGVEGINPLQVEELRDRGVTVLWK